MPGPGPGPGELGLGVADALLLLLLSAAPAPADQTLLAGRVRGVGAGVRESLATVLAFERFFSGVDSLVFLQMMLELECFATMRALELSEVRAISMVGHVPLEFVKGGELFATQTAGLK